MAKILLVEDDNNLREIYEARLQAEGYTIVSAMDGEAALVVAKQERPDLIISDVMMPRVSGFEMLDILRNTDGLKHVKVIMLTALGQAEDKIRADSLGADRYLVKSQVTLEDIVKAAQELLVEAGAAPAEAAPAPPIAAPTVAEPTTAPTPVASVAPEASAPLATVPVVTVPPITVVEPPVPVVTPPIATAAVPIASDTTTAAPTTTAPIETATGPIVAAETAPPVPAPAPPITEPKPIPAPAQSRSIPAAQTTSEEEAAIKAQIEQFVNSQTTPTPPPMPATEEQATPAAPVNEASEPAPAAVPANTSPSPTPRSSAADHAFMTNAINDLVSDTNAPAKEQVPPKIIAPPVDNASVPVAATAPTTSVTPVNQSDNDEVTVAHKKVISPITTTAERTPNLDELLAKEGFDSFDEPHAPAPTAHVVTSPSMSVPATGIAPATASQQPNTTASAAANMPGVPHPPGHVISPNNTSSVDPNSIAL